MSEKEEIELVIARYNELIDLGTEEFDIDLLKKAIFLGKNYGINVDKLAKKLEELTDEKLVHFK
ncbi:MAG: hypothetical protein QXM68_02240 [Candidatus Aenigmatarchaeota archaeon]|nr:hypothetical protein [Candidatus Aenigmarchaeota archaeon]